MALKYNPKRMNRESWLSLDDDEKLFAVENYHRKAGIELPDTRLHAVLHVIVENQVAMGEEINVLSTLERLMEEGLDRHEAIHAIGSVLTSHMYDLLEEKPEGGFDVTSYHRDLEALTAERWLSGDLFE